MVQLLLQILNKQPKNFAFVVTPFVSQWFKTTFGMNIFSNERINIDIRCGCRMHVFCLAFFPFPFLLPLSDTEPVGTKENDNCFFSFVFSGNPCHNVYLYVSLPLQEQHSEDALFPVLLPHICVSLPLQHLQLWVGPHPPEHPHHWWSKQNWPAYSEPVCLCTLHSCTARSDNLSMKQLFPVCGLGAGSWNFAEVSPASSITHNRMLRCCRGMGGRDFLHTTNMIPTQFCHLSHVIQPMYKCDKGGGSRILPFFNVKHTLFLFQCRDHWNLISCATD